MHAAPSEAARLSELDGHAGIVRPVAAIACSFAAVRAGLRERRVRANAGRHRLHRRRAGSAWARTPRTSRPTPARTSIEPYATTPTSHAPRSSCQTGTGADRHAFLCGLVLHDEMPAQGGHGGAHELASDGLSDAEASTATSSKLAPRIQCASAPHWSAGEVRAGELEKLTCRLRERDRGTKPQGLQRRRGRKLVEQPLDAGTGIRSAALAVPSRCRRPSRTTFRVTMRIQSANVLSGFVAARCRTASSRVPRALRASRSRPQPRRAGGPRSGRPPPAAACQRQQARPEPDHQHVPGLGVSVPGPGSKHLAVLEVELRERVAHHCPPIRRLDSPAPTVAGCDD